MAKTKVQLEAENARLRAALITKARDLESLRNENYDLRWQLGLTQQAQDDPNKPFEPNGLIGTPGYVQDYLARIKADLKSKGRRHA